MSATLLFVLFLSGCTHYYYVPNVQNVPLFREKNEYRFSGLLGYANEELGTTCIDFQVAYSLSDRIGIMMNYMSAYEEYKSGENTVSEYGRGSYLEGAVGYYKPVGRYGVFEIYGGLGTSGQHHQYIRSKYDSYFNTYSSQFAGTSDLSFIKLFIQPSIGLTLNSCDAALLKPFDIAFSTRIYSVNYGKIDYTNSEIANEENLSALSKKNHLFVEPAITIRGGWKVVKLQFQFAYAAYLNNPNLDFYEKCHASVGLYVALGNKAKKIIPETIELNE
jgi:hypothetical protein